MEDIEDLAPLVFRKGREYSITDKVEDVRLPALTDEEFEEFDKAIDVMEEGKYHLIEILEAELIHSFNDIDLKQVLPETIFIGIDGSSERIRREELVFLFARSIAYVYPFSNNASIQPKFHRRISRAFFIIDKGLLRPGSEAKIEAKSIDLASVFNGEFSIVEYRKERKKNVGSQAMGYEVRLRNLSELSTVIDALSLYGTNQVLTVVLVVDGPIVPRSSKQEEYVEVYKKIIENRSVLVCGFVKRVADSQLFLNLLRSQSKVNAALIKAFFHTDDASFLDRFVSDGVLLRNILKPMQSTFFFRYDVKGKTDRVIDENLKPVATYIMTKRGEIFRIEFPYFYFKTGRHLDIVRKVIALSVDNNGSLPKPIQIADKLAGVKSKERRALSAWVDYLFERKLEGIKLTKPYGE